MLRHLDNKIQTKKKQTKSKEKIKLAVFLERPLYEGKF